MKSASNQNLGLHEPLRSDRPRQMPQPAMDCDQLPLDTHDTAANALSQASNVQSQDWASSQASGVQSQDWAPSQASGVQSQDWARAK